ncbi:hypothetical protein HMPREF0682_2357 [Propionibacterium acidifaciens F0233]|uniref:GIY-YIG catalytic domain protein n=1 Tax=Propionibacterium acidifaciens F0233 TaxID=553198 RepID=U2QHA8_9ACTN|nr:hypothetical protein [Propionibacterium acidifaciens]ERK62280.1 hypothetical protein HMPREF0682_2357 [Propionibacterium acidifaciens F0233]
MATTTGQPILVHNDTACTQGDDLPRGGVYTLSDPDTGEVVRTGRTNDLARRQSEHQRNSVTENLQFDAVHYTDNYAEQRGLEQIVYDKNPQAMASNGGLNKVRPISPKNKNRESYMDAANKHLEHDEGGS